MKHNITKKIGVLLVNIGSPASTSTADVRAYLREFLSDPRVIDIPRLFKYLLLYLFILPFRPKVSAAAYKKIWTTQGSPLLVNSLSLKEALSQRLGPEYQVELGMRYQKPSLKQALQALKSCEKIIVFPQYPQYAASSTGSSLAYIFDEMKDWWNIPAIFVVPPFFAEPAFIEAVRQGISLKDDEHLLFSFHGLPERQILKSEGRSCLEACPGPEPFCYRSQCFVTANAVAEQLKLSKDQYSVSFQSRLGRSPWIKPYTDVMFTDLRKRGIRKLAVVCPSFTADCLETLEEIGIRAQETWLALGGEELRLIPCLNADPAWVKACQGFILSF